MSFLCDDCTIGSFATAGQLAAHKEDIKVSLICGEYQEVQYHCPGCRLVNCSSNTFHAHIRACAQYDNFLSGKQMRCPHSTAIILAEYPKGAIGAALLRIRPIEDRFDDEKVRRNEARQWKKWEKSITEEEERRNARYAAVHPTLAGEIMPSLEARPRYYHPHAQMPLHPPSEDCCWECKCIDHEHQDDCTQKEKNGAFPDDNGYQRIYGVEALTAPAPAPAPLPMVQIERKELIEVFDSEAAAIARLLSMDETVRFAIRIHGA